MLPFRHWHHRILLDPLFQLIGIETECPTELHKRDSTLTDHRVQGMRGEARVAGHFLNSQKTTLNGGRFAHINHGRRSNLRKPLTRPLQCPAVNCHSSCAQMNLWWPCYAQIPPLSSWLSVDDRVCLGDEPDFP